jgi:hypothetical protein
MHLIELALLAKVAFCSALFFCADLFGSSLVAFVDVSGCWSGKTLKSPWKGRRALACAPAGLSQERSFMEISIAGYGSKAALSGARRVSRENHGQVSALFTEEGIYAR